VTAFKPGDKVLVTIPCVIDDDGSVRSAKANRHFRDSALGRLFAPAEVEKHFDATITPIPDEPAPYTPRDGDEVEVVRGPIRGRVTVRDDGRAWIGGAGDVYVDIDMFAEAIAEGRVRLIKAAPAPYEPGRIYRDADGSHYVYLPANAAIPGESFFELSSAAWWGDPGDLEPMDLVPAREVS